MDDDATYWDGEEWENQKLGFRHNWLSLRYSVVVMSGR